jgi:hypothetical protein
MLYSPPVNQILSVVEDTSLISASKDFLLQDDILIYPNPASHTLYFAPTGDIRIQQATLIDMQGRQRGVVKGADLSLMQLPDVEDGTYILRLVTTDNILYKKLLISQIR